MILVQIVLEKFQPKPSGAVFWMVFFCDNCRLEVDGGILPGADVEQVGMDYLSLKFGFSRSNRFRLRDGRTTTPAYAGNHIMTKRLAASCLRADAYMLKTWAR